MKKTTLVFFSILCFAQILLAQVGGNVGIGTSNPDSTSILELKSSKKGFLIPRMSTLQRDSIINPALGLVVFDETTESFWYKKTSGWKEISVSGIAGPGGTFIKDIDGDTKIDTEDSADEDAIRIKLGGKESLILTRDHDTTWTRLIFPNNNGNIVIGQNSLTRLGTEENAGNTVVGDYSMTNNLSGFYNVAVGSFAMNKNSGGYFNTAIGNNALRENIDGYGNTGLGFASLFQNTQGWQNTALGHQSMFFNKLGGSNTAIGWEALKSNVNGFNNTAVGISALSSNLVSENTAIGSLSLQKNTSGFGNIAMGYSSLNQNITGGSNTALGYLAMYFNVGGSDNTAVGNTALNKTLGDKNTGIGSKSLKDNDIGFQNTALGYASLTQNIRGMNNVAVGFNTLSQNKDGVSNTGVGAEALLSNNGKFNTALGASSLKMSDGSFNTAVGYNALLNLSMNFDQNTAIGALAGAKSFGNNNILIGYGPGENLSGNNNLIIGNVSAENSVGSNNVYIGNGAGSGIIASNQLRIANNQSTSLIEGDFLTGNLKLNGNTQIVGNLFSTTETTGRLYVGSYLTVNGGGDHMAYLDSDKDNGLKITIDQSETSRVNNFITFANSNGTIGRIEGFRATTDWVPPSADDSFADFACYMSTLTSVPTNPLDLLSAYAEAAIAIACRDGGVIYESGNGDYAEWLEREDPLSNYSFGQVVGVRGGKISLKTDGAEQLLVVSMAPIMLGNMPKGKEENFEKVAFMGQVPVWVRGQVRSGDYILSSGFEDGTAIAVGEENLTIDQVAKIVGRAWADGSNDRLSLVNTVVGVRTPELAKLMMSFVKNLESKNQALQISTNSLEATTDDLNDRLIQLERLISKNLVGGK